MCCMMLCCSALFNVARKDVRGRQTMSAVSQHIRRNNNDVTRSSLAFDMFTTSRRDVFPRGVRIECSQGGVEFLAVSLDQPRWYPRFTPQPCCGLVLDRSAGKMIIHKYSTELGLRVQGQNHIDCISAWSCHFIQVSLKLEELAGQKVSAHTLGGSHNQQRRPGDARFEIDCAHASWLFSKILRGPTRQVAREHGKTGLSCENVQVAFLCAHSRLTDSCSIMKR
jgi:hypothetical protein